MRNETTVKSDRRTAWVAPKLVTLSAGSAEAGTGTIPDGGGPGNSRS